MTAREVLQEIEQRRDLRMISVPDVDAMLAALRAVLDLCDDRAAFVARYPGETDAFKASVVSRAITDALSGVTTGTDR